MYFKHPNGKIKFQIELNKISFLNILKDFYLNQFIDIESKNKLNINKKCFI